VPLAVVMRDSKVTYTFELEDVSYTGPCSLSYVLTIGTTKIDSGSYKFPAGCKPNTAYFASFNRTFKTSIKTGVGAMNGTLKGGMHTDTITQKFCFTLQPTILTIRAAHSSFYSNGFPGESAAAEIQNHRSSGRSDYDLAARETAKLSSSIWKREILLSDTVRMIAKADSIIFLSL